MIQILHLNQKDRYHFEIKWSDGVVQQFCLSKVQEACPCARCAAEKRKECDPKTVATKIRQVGNYALQFFFIKGCSKGMYPFELLRELGE